MHACHAERSEASFCLKPEISHCLAHELYVKEKTSNGVPTKFVWDYDLKPVTVVAILNFRFDHSDDWPADHFLSSYRLREDFNHEEMTDVLRFVFLELGRFNKKIWEVETVFDKWMYLLKHMHEMEEIPLRSNNPGMLSSAATSASSVVSIKKQCHFSFETRNFL